MLNRSALHPYVKFNRHHPPIPPPQSWAITALCDAYGFPTNTKGRGSIAIIELGGGYLDTDIQQAFSSAGMPIPNITNVSVDGTQNSPGGSSADVEVALDIQVAGIVFSKMTGEPATIRMYWAQDIASAVQRAAQDGCAVCSISWGADETEWGVSAVDDMEAVAEAAVKSGMIVFAASGDNDSSDGGMTPANVDCPASCPHIIGCGGTTKTINTETVWGTSNPDGNGTGGGYSMFFPAQSWQAGVPAAPSGLGRMVPDVAGNADPRTGYQIVVHNLKTSVGGTSAVAPLWAGAIAAIGASGFITPKLYQNPMVFKNPIAGTNGTYSQPPCPGPCTGLGSPTGSKLAALF